MKKILLIISLGLFTLGLYSQSIKVSALPAATSISGADLHLIVQSGVTKKICDSLLLKNRTFLGTLTVPAITLNGTDLETALDDKLDPSDTANIDSRLNVLETDTINIEDVCVLLEDLDSAVMLALDDEDFIYKYLNTGIKAESYGCRISEMTSVSSDMTDGSAYFQAVPVKKDTTLTGAKLYMADAGNFTGDNFNGIALYSYSAADDTCRKVATSANAEAVWEVPNNITTIAFTSTYEATAGIYFLGILYNSSAVTTAPETGQSQILSALYFWDFSVYLSSQTELPEKFKLSDATNNTIARWFVLY